MKVNAKITKIIDKPDSSIKAFASVTLDGYFAVHGVKVCEGEKGLFVSIVKKGDMYTKELLPEYFIRCVVAIQRKMRELISYKGIAVETNPSSNLLISGMEDYSEHPISFFYDYGLKNNGTEMLMNVSINTDDRSVFSTSLSNEYAYLMFYLENKKNENGENMYTRFNILKWLDAIRKMGNEQSF